MHKKLPTKLPEFLMEYNSFLIFLNWQLLGFL